MPQAVLAPLWEEGLLLAADHVAKVTSDAQQASANLDEFIANENEAAAVMESIVELQATQAAAMDAFADSINNLAAMLTDKTASSAASAPPPASEEESGLCEYRGKGGTLAVGFILDNVTKYYNPPPPLRSPPPPVDTSRKLLRAGKGGLATDDEPGTDRDLEEYKPYQGYKISEADPVLRLPAKFKMRRFVAVKHKLVAGILMVVRFRIMKKTSLF